MPTGTAIRNVATVIFDVNPPITTDQVNENDPSQGVDPAKQALNTIDSGAPTSSVTALPAVSPASFTVTWAGQDDSGGSGIASYDVFVSDNGGKFTLWQSDTTATSATFTGVDGHTYGFYSIATDHVGLVQATPSIAQAMTTSTQSAPKATSFASVSGTGIYAGDASLSATLTSNGSPVTGKSVAFTWNIGGAITTLGSATTNANGVATLGGITLTGISAGTYVGSVGAAFAADATDSASTGSGALVIAQATPKVSWLKPADITYGTALGTTQLEAKAFVPGTFTYAPALGTILTAGQGQSLSTTFTPTDAKDYHSVTMTTTINVAARAVPPVTVLGIRWQTRKLAHKKPAKVIVVSFSDPLNPRDAHNLSAYHLVAAGKDKKFGTRDDKSVPIASVKYDPLAHTMTLTPRGTVPNQTLQLGISAALTLDAQGRPIDGNRDSQPGGDFKARFGKGGASLASTFGSGTTSRVSAAALDKLLVMGRLPRHRRTGPDS